MAAILLIPAVGSVLGRPLAGSAPATSWTAETAASTNLSRTWMLLPPQTDQPLGRAGAALAFDPVEGLGVLFGGRAANGSILNDTWVNDGDYPGLWGDNPDTLELSPPPLVDAALAFDATLNEFLLFGGALSNGTAYRGTWIFNNFVWSDFTGRLPTAPPADVAPTMAFDPATGEVVLVSSADPGATWTFGSAGWALLPSSEWLAPTTNSTAVEDPSLGGVLLFGGRSPGADPVARNATWMLQSGGWEPAPTARTPPAEARPAMAYDPRIPGVLLYSGTASPSTWTYTSTGWSPLTGGPVPAARSDAQFYYDSDASYDSLFGGVASNETISADNWGWSVPPVVLTPTLGAAGVGLATWVEIGAVIAVPIVVALFLRLRPPRAKPADAPAATGSTAPS
jgi:hypothetical protein